MALFLQEFSQEERAAWRAGLTTEGGAPVATSAIVIVEDNAAIAALLQEVLNDVVGYGAVTVHDGALALEVLSAIHTDLVILDVDLPGLSGLEVYDWLRQRPATATVPCLFMSAALHLEELAHRQITDYLAKPFDIDELLARVATLLTRPRLPAPDAGASQPR